MWFDLSVVKSRLNPKQSQTDCVQTRVLIWYDSYVIQSTHIIGIPHDSPIPHRAPGTHSVGAWALHLPRPLRRFRPISWVHPQGDPQGTDIPNYRGKDVWRTLLHPVAHGSYAHHSIFLKLGPNFWSSVIFWSSVKVLRNAQKPAKIIQQAKTLFYRWFKGTIRIEIYVIRPKTFRDCLKSNLKGVNRRTLHQHVILAIHVKQNTHCKRWVHLGRKWNHSQILGGKIKL